MEYCEDWVSVRENSSMKSKATDLGTVCESFTYTLKAYQFETRKQETSLACSSQSQHKHELTT